MLCSCNKQGLLLHERQGREDFSAFLSIQIVKYGGSNISFARGAAIGISNYVYSVDKDGFQVVCIGNKVAALRNMLQPHFGEPALTTTNAGGLSSFVYAVRQTGVAINCGLDRGMVDGARQEITHLVIVKADALR